MTRQSCLAFAESVWLGLFLCLCFPAVEINEIVLNVVNLFSTYTFHKVVVLWHFGKPFKLNVVGFSPQMKKRGLTLLSFKTVLFKA